MKRLLLSAVVLMAGLSGCTTATQNTADAAKPASQVWREFVTCARQNGQQNMPDPVVDEQGRATFPAAPGFNEKEAYKLVKDACGPILNGLPAGANPLAVQPPNPEQARVLQRYVQCMRDNGMPDMPDPGPNGEIRDPERYAEGPLRDVRNAARNVCDHILLEDYK